MNSENNKERVPFQHYLALYQAADPEEIASRCKLTRREDKFVVRLLNREYELSHPYFHISPNTLSASEQILLLRYLTGGSYRQSSGEFLAYRDMPWGKVYNTNFTGRCIQRLARKFGSSSQTLVTAAQRLGGKPLSLADGSAQLELLPGLELQLLVWEGDEEFKASAQILFSDNFPAAFAAEDMAFVGDIVLDALTKVL